MVMKHSSSSSQIKELTSAGLAAFTGRRPTRTKRHNERMRGPQARTISLTYRKIMYWHCKELSYFESFDSFLVKFDLSRFTRSVSIRVNFWLT